MHLNQDGHWKIIKKALIFGTILILVTLLMPHLTSKTAEAFHPQTPDATISGVIRHQGSLVSGATVTANWAGNQQTQTTGVNGSYNINGVPIGGYVKISAEPPAGQQWATHHWSTDSLIGDITKNFNLLDGYRVTGEFHLPNGNLYSGIPPSLLPIDLVLPSGEFLGPAMDPNNQLDLILPPAHYAMIENAEFTTYFLPHQIFDMTSGDLYGLVFTLQYRPTILPDAPPRAALIQVGLPDVDGYANVIGEPGAVQPQSAVIVINLNANNLAITVSEDDGSFVARLFTPQGSSLLVKYDPKGDQVAMAWAKSTYDMPGVALLNSLPGMIIRTGNLPVVNESQVSFSTVGSWTESAVVPVLMNTDSQEDTAQTETVQNKWAGWWITGTLTLPAPGHLSETQASNRTHTLTVQPGEIFTLTTYLHATSQVILCSEPVSYTPSIQIQLLGIFGEDGRQDYWGAWFTSYLFTPTGLPIERESFGNQRLVTSVSINHLTCASDHTLQATITLPIQIPLDLPPGIYFPQVELGRGDIPLEEAHIVPVWYNYIPGALMPVRVGSPAEPRIAWSLFDEHPINGTRGVMAREDEGYFAMPNRAITTPYQYVAPRYDERSGTPIVYKIEPGSNWISSTDRRQPNPPVIQFAFPSGNFFAEIIRPDGQVDQLGPAPIVQSTVRTPTTKGGALLNDGTGYIGDPYHLTTLNDDFNYVFSQDGRHIIFLGGYIDDIYGNRYPIQGTYEVYIARVLDLDPNQLPTTPYEQGDAFAPGLHIYPPVPAKVAIRLIQMPLSDPTKIIETLVSGEANQYGYFQPPAGTEIRLEMPGEFRVDISAIYTDTTDAENPVLWMGAMTWGNVIEGTTAKIAAHGRRGMDNSPNRLPWFEVENLPPGEKLTHVNYPYFSGDIHWGAEDNIPGDSIQAIITVEDLTPAGQINNLLRNYASYPFNTIEGNIEEYITKGELPLFTPGRGWKDPGVFPEVIELFSYWYGSSQRPDVRVREVVNITNMPTAYWRFNDTYGYQIGEPADGDQPGDIKWEFGGAVLRVISETQPLNEYAIYSSLWVMLPHNDPVGARVSPPFQDATGGSINGGAILTLKGEEIDMLFLPKGVRPGDILELGNTISFSGHVGPPLDSHVVITITSPSGVQHLGDWHANKIGWVYDPTFDFPAEEAGCWTVDVQVTHDRPYLPTGTTPTNHNTGTVLGTSGRYEFYVVEPDSHRLFLTSPQPGFLTFPDYQIGPVTIRGIAPQGTTQIYYTIHDKGIVMGQGSLTPDQGGSFSLVYDAESLHQDFPMLSLTAHEGRWEGLADEVSIRFLAVGCDSPRAASVTLIGEEVFWRNDIPYELIPIYLPLLWR